jgi:ferredoxin
MPLKITKSLRVFIILLITVFLSNTVYAGGMMAAEQLTPSDITVESHHHDASAMAAEHDHHSHNANQDSNHHSDDDKDASNHCSKCTHCIACISAIPSEATQDLSLDLYQAFISTFEFQYVSIITPLLQKPPISI